MTHSITWASSKQSYITARLLADRHLADDCLRAYAYFRWADDTIDISLGSTEERIRFIARQEMLIEQLYRGERAADLSPEEEMLADLIAHDRSFDGAQDRPFVGAQDRGPESGLQSFIRNFMAVIAFDATRVGRLVSRRELTAYTQCLATAVMDGLLYFISNGHPYPQTQGRNLAVVGAHITHILRDILEDVPAGFINIPAEDIKAFGIQIEDVESEPFRLWVCGQVGQARAYFRAGKGYINSLDVLRAKLAGVWYCARFECILNTIEHDGYRLRSAYPERHCLRAWLEMFRLGIAVTAKHLAGRIILAFPYTSRQVAFNSEGCGQPSGEFDPSKNKTLRFGESCSWGQRI